VFRQAKEENFFRLFLRENQSTARSGLMQLLAAIFIRRLLLSFCAQTCRRLKASFRRLTAGPRDCTFFWLLSLLFAALRGYFWALSPLAFHSSAFVSYKTKKPETRQEEDA
jgi:hypothetical protein